MFQVISSLVPVSNWIVRENSQKIAKNRFKSNKSTANFSICDIRFFRINGFPDSHFSKSEFKNEILRCALLDIQMTLLCVCGVNSCIPELEHLIKKLFTVSFPKRTFWNQIHGFRFMKWSWGQLPLQRNTLPTRLLRLLGLLENRKKIQKSGRSWTHF